MAIPQRRIVVNVADLIITDLRITVSLTVDASNSQDPGDVAIYNLARDTESQIFDRGKEIVVSAGYEGEVGVIYEGQMQRVQRVRRRSGGIARVTQIKLGTLTRSPVAVRGVQPLGGVTARSYAGSESVRRIAADLIGDMGLDAATLNAIPASATALNWAWTGAASDALTGLLSAHRLGWYEDSGQIRVRRRGSAAQPDGGHWLVTPATGLVGSPTDTDEGVRVELFLNPAVRRGDRVELESENTAGDYTVVAISHQADNWEGKFTTGLELRPA